MWRYWHAVQVKAPSHAFVLQEPRAAFSAAELRQLLRGEQLAPEALICFSGKDLEHLVDKGLKLPPALRTADVAMLEKPPELPEALIRLFLAKFNPDALTAGTGRAHHGTPKPGLPSTSRRWQLHKWLLGVTAALRALIRLLAGIMCKPVLLRLRYLLRIEQALKALGWWGCRSGLAKACAAAGSMPCGRDTVQGGSNCRLVIYLSAADECCGTLAR